MEKSERFEQEKRGISSSEVKTFEQELAGQVNIKLIYGDYPNEPNPVFAVQFQSKLTEDQPTITILESELLTNTKEKQLKLIQHCGLDINQYHHLLMHINELKKNRCITMVPSIYAVMNPCAEFEEGVELYEKLHGNIQSQIHHYPLLSTGTFQPNDLGMILNTKAYGQNVVAVTTDTLYKLLDWDQNSENKNRLQNLCEAWVDLGYLIKPSKERYNKWIPLGKQRFYLIKIRNLEQMLRRGDTKNE
ncbi:hypothetical protein [Paenibacillus campinasensis]|uniref:Uncharacterized protein n=1 Tax=Paenibacillus campinasensis TaxID=66347 RepID=A0A268ETD3_9BACL|nr:hypothetical protein [Paenibacillus campinasensis]PAD76370.1 hypothetical protein CHH67_12125 [Paenibacillus campinasensis]